MWIRNILTIGACLLGTAVSLTAASKFDLARTTPVAADQPIPIEDFFRPAAMQAPKLNLTGTHMATTISVGEDRERLLVHEFATRKDDFFGGVDQRNVYDFEWLDASRVTFSIATKRKYMLALMAGNAGDLGNSWPILQYNNSIILAAPLANRLQPLVQNHWDMLADNMNRGAVVVDSGVKGGRLVDDLSNRPDSPLRTPVIRANERAVLKRYPEPYERDGIGTTYIPDREGRIAFATTTYRNQRQLLRLEGNAWVKCPVDLEEIDVLGAGDLPGQLLVRGPYVSGQPRALQVMEGATGKLGEVLVQDKAYDYSGSFRRDPATNELLGTTMERNGPRMIWFSENYRNLQKLLEGFFPGVIVRVIGSNTAQNFFLVATFSDRQPETYHWVDLEKRTAGVIRNSQPWLDPQRMRPMNIIRYKTRDGRELDAYLTLPAGATKEKPAALVVLPPASPASRHSWGFSHEAQYFASRGYAVLQPNYRGSTGYTWLFPREDEWDFRKASDDINDATKTVIASGLVDSQRVGIFGRSFGGYLAVAGAVNEPGLYRSVVAIDGIYDWERLLSETKFEQYRSAFFSYWSIKLGDPKKNADKFAQIAPARQADKLNVPTFISAERDDYGEILGQAKRLASNLERRDVPVELYVRTEDLMSVSDFENRMNIMTRVDAFLGKYLKPVAPGK